MAVSSFRCKIIGTHWPCSATSVVTIQGRFQLAGVISVQHESRS
jgi:hypothetical protein